MFGTSISGSVFSGLAGSGHTQVPVLRKDESGIILTLDLKVSSHRKPNKVQPGSLSGFKTSLPPSIIDRFIQSAATINCPEIDDLAFMYAITYFDKVVYSVPCDPISGQPFLRFSEIQKRFFELDASSVMPVYPEGPSGELSGLNGRLSFDHLAFESFRVGCGIEFSQLLDRDGPEWQIGNGSYGVYLEPKNLSSEGLLFRLHDKLPVVTEAPDPHDFLLWKEKRRPERRALSNAVNEFIGSIGEVSSAELESKLQSIEKQCHDLVRVSREKFPSVVLRPVNLHFNWDKAKTGRDYGAFSGGVAGTFLGSTEIGGAVGFALGHIAGFDIKGGPTLRTNVAKASPFASVLDLQYRSA